MAGIHHSHHSHHSHYSHHSKESAEDRHRRKQKERHHDYEQPKRKYCEKYHNDDEQQKRNPNEINNSEKPQKKQADKVNIKDCKTTVTSETLPLFENIPHPTEVTARPVTVKIPVVLTEFTVSITVESLLKLDALLEIKHIRKNVFLNQCKLIPNSENGKPNTGILFLEGFIRKNIEYATKEHNDKGVSCGKVKHTTIKVPFKCATRVTFKTPPKFKTTTPEAEVEVLETSVKVSNPCEESIIGRDICQQNLKIIEFFNEKVFCELISAEIVESDILENPTNEECKSPFDRTFHHITEKAVLFLTIKLLQNQNIEIPK